MSLTTRAAFASLTVCVFAASRTMAQLPQQPAAAPPQQQAVAPQQQAPPQAPPGFQLNQLEEAFLDQVLSAWELQSGKISTFRCSFERWEYNPTFGPGLNIPLNKDKGELSFQKPDKGSFQITEIKRWQTAPAPPGQQPPQPAKGDWAAQKDAIGEHWVCDGKSVFEYRHDQKQLVERPIPAELQGQAIVDGPLPFLFGADAKKLKARYWLRVEQQPDANQIWLVALPRFQAQAADFRAVRVILDRQKMLPVAMQVQLPDNSRHEYMFDVPNATINSRFEKLQQFFERPRTPLGWKRVVEQPPVQQAAQPAAAPR